MTNPFAADSGRSRTTTSSTCDMRGPVVTAAIRSVIAAAGPWASMKTPALSLPTWPTMPSRVASPCTNGPEADPLDHAGDPDLDVPLAHRRVPQGVVRA